MQPDHDLDTIIPEQCPLVTIFEPQPILLQFIREADPPPTIDGKSDVLRASEVSLSSGLSVRLFRDQLARNETVVGLGTKLNIFDAFLTYFSLLQVSSDFYNLCPLTYISKRVNYSGVCTCVWLVGK